MNSSPDTSGIRKRWVPGEDDRVDLKRNSGLSPAQVDRALAGLWKTILSKPRTKIVGFGTFEWKFWRRRIPTGRMVETWRLAFKPSRYAKKYGGRNA